MCILCVRAVYKGTDNARSRRQGEPYRERAWMKRIICSMYVPYWPPPSLLCGDRLLFQTKPTARLFMCISIHHTRCWWFDLHINTTRRHTCAVLTRKLYIHTNSFKNTDADTLPVLLRFWTRTSADVDSTTLQSPPTLNTPQFNHCSSPNWHIYLVTHILMALNARAWMCKYTRRSGMLLAIRHMYNCGLKSAVELQRKIYMYIHIPQYDFYMNSEENLDILWRWRLTSRLHYWFAQMQMILSVNTITLSVCIYLHKYAKSIIREWYITLIMWVRLRA